MIGFSKQRWDRAHERVVRSSFASVPFYRERWALVTGDPAGVAELEQRRDDLVPIGGTPRFDPRRGLDRLLRRVDHTGAAWSARDPLPAGATAGSTIRDGLLGDLAVLRDCGHWHLDWRRIYARNTPRGVAFTLLRQQSPRLVDVVVAPGPLRVMICPRHHSPGVTA